jgi:hypothetical protein
MRFGGNEISAQRIKHCVIWRSGSRWTGEGARLSTERFLSHSCSSLTQLFPSGEWVDAVWRRRNLGTADKALRDLAQRFEVDGRGRPSLHRTLSLSFLFFLNSAVPIR